MQVANRLCLWNMVDVVVPLGLGLGWGGAPPSLAQWCDQEEHGKERQREGGSTM